MIKRKIKSPLTKLLTSQVCNGRYYIVFTALLSFLQIIFINDINGQAQVQPWGNITGIRIKGELMQFESSIKVAEGDWSKIISTGKEKQRPKYIRDSSNRQVVSANIGNLFFTEKVEDINTGTVRVDIQFTSKADTTIAGAFFCIEIPYNDYAKGTVNIAEGNKLPISKLVLNNGNEYLRASSKSIEFISLRRQIKIVCSEPNLIIIKPDTKKDNKNFQLYLPIDSGYIQKGTIVQKTFIIKASGIINTSAVHLKLDASVQGRTFNGFGGNFRIQNLKTDPQVIDYSLKNLRVAWGRVEMPWRFWQPEKNTDPIAEAKAGKLNANVQRAMEMAQKLSRMGIPVILTAWSPPAWAISGKPNFRHQPGGEWGNPLNKDSINEIYKSIADYIIYLKENYAADIEMFSFNESDLGINIRQTGREHAELIKGLGAYFAMRGLKTKMLLGDNSDATTYEFIYPALHDPGTRPYIGAISFHSWRGWEKEILQKWTDASRELNLPLIVGEGSTDAAAWNYPDIFAEQVYVMEEINLYIRLLAICQPLSILQWQLTADYSPLTGGGIFGKEGPLMPSQRFWNFKQLASTPKDLKYMSLTCDQNNISCAALGNNATASYTIHLVNNGASRNVSLSGIPGKVKSFKIYITDRNRSMKEGVLIKVANGRVNFQLDAGTYTTLVSK
jgi:O-glycosyl hydrolase